MAAEHLKKLSWYHSFSNVEGYLEVYYNDRYYSRVVDWLSSSYNVVDILTEKYFLDDENSRVFFKYESDAIIFKLRLS